MARREEEKQVILGRKAGDDASFAHWERSRAAKTIQCAWRKYDARLKRRRRARVRPTARTRERAARIIQRAFRQYKVTKEYHIDDDNVRQSSSSSVLRDGSTSTNASMNVRTFDEERSMRIRLNFEKRVRSRSAELASTDCKDDAGAIKLETVRKVSINRSGSLLEE